MRTTIDIPDALALRAKMVAVQRQSTLRGVIVQALEKELSGREAPAGRRGGSRSSRLPLLSTAGRKAHSLSPSQVAEILGDQEGIWHGVPR